MKTAGINFKSHFLLLLIIVSSNFAKAQTGYKVGDLAKDFSLKNVDNKMVVLADYPDAKGFFVIFTCNHCPYAKMYEQRIMDLDKKFAPQGYPVIAINPNDPKAYPEDSFENMKKRSAEKKYTFPYLLDETQDIAKTYGAKATPHVYLLQKTKRGLEVAYIGAIDNDTENVNQSGRNNYADNAVEAIMKNKKPQITQTKAIGCSIKWKDEN
ncbi:thioredoxin family protein [Pedobacter sp. SD-b]|uniref:Thioredoxin family protein n=1 Tax=Pedobacter segetis TaxID=2793069 RepID=A0ABS1BFI9_9SPHI|nr:thioredoxin family protein [Pedobacter segetis]MBK0381634.1 thioredoxin family protein [Pedobacter segetis]